MKAAFFFGVLIAIFALVLESKAQTIEELDPQLTKFFIDLEDSVKSAKNRYNEIEKACRVELYGGKCQITGEILKWDWDANKVWIRGQAWSKSGMRDHTEGQILDNGHEQKANILILNPDVSYISKKHYRGTHKYIGKSTENDQVSVYGDIFTKSDISGCLSRQNEAEVAWEDLGNKLVNCWADSVISLYESGDTTNAKRLYFILFESRYSLIKPKSIFFNKGKYFKQKANTMRKIIKLSTNELSEGMPDKDIAVTKITLAIENLKDYYSIDYKGPYDKRTARYKAATIMRLVDEALLLHPAVYIPDRLHDFFYLTTIKWAEKSTKRVDPFGSGSFGIDECYKSIEKVLIIGTRTPEQESLLEKAEKYVVRDYVKWIKKTTKDFEKTEYVKESLIETVEDRIDRVLQFDPENVQIPKVLPRIEAAKEKNSNFIKE